MRLRAILFDIDGTLVLSNDAHARAWVEAFAAHGYRVEYSRVRSLIGMGGDKLIPEVAPGLRDDEGEGQQIGHKRKAIFLQRYAPHLEPAPGARALLTHLRAQGLKLAVASSAKEDELSVLLRAAEVQDMFEEAATSDDAAESKPAPDVVQAALTKARLEPEEAFMIGDTPYDIRSAQGAGVRIIAVRCGGWKDPELAGAAAVYEDPADLLAQLTSSPLHMGVARNL